VGQRRGNRDAEVDFDEVGDDSREQCQHQQLPVAGRTVGGFRGGPAAQQQVDGDVDDHARDQPGRQPDAGQTQAAVREQGHDDAERAAAHDKCNEDAPPVGPAQQPQPAERVVEDGAVED